MISSLKSILKSKSYTLRMLPPQKEMFDALASRSCVQRSAISTSIQSSKENDRVYAPYYVYKGKAALCAEPVLPKFSRLHSGGLKVDRRGGIMLTFSPAVGERKYDWERKQSYHHYGYMPLVICNKFGLPLLGSLKMFSLSATEIGSLISLGPNDSCELFHDPAMQTSNAGQVRKSLSVKPHADGSGYFVSLSVVNSVLQTNERFTVPVTSAEFSVMRQAFSFALPYIMGWHRYTDHLEEKTSTLDAPTLRIDSEWEK